MLAHVILTVLPSSYAFCGPIDSGGVHITITLNCDVVKPE
jgi:hypothetical protein